MQQTPITCLKPPGCFFPRIAVCSGARSLTKQPIPPGHAPDCVPGQTITATCFKSPNSLPLSAKQTESETLISPHASHLHHVPVRSSCDCGLLALTRCSLQEPQNP